MLDVGCYVLQKSKEKAQLFPKLYPPFGSIGVIDHISPGGYSVQWRKEGFKNTMYIYTEDDLICTGKAKPVRVSVQSQSASGFRLLSKVFGKTPVASMLPFERPTAL